MSLTNVRNVVFDMGGVLLKWEPLFYARSFCDNDEDATALAQAVFGSTEWALQDAGAVSAETVAWTAKHQLPERLHDQADSLAHHWFEHRQMIEGMGPLIRELKQAGYGIYLLSNAGPQFEFYKQSLPAYDCFDGMVVSCYEHVVKPDAAIYHTLLNRYGLEAKTCLFVDDMAKNVEGAERVGMRGWHFDGDADAMRTALLAHGTPTA